NFAMKKSLCISQCNMYCTDNTLQGIILYDGNVPFLLLRRPIMQRFATLKQLNALYITANAGSVTEAARILHVTQPTVTLQIKQLEEAAGLPLFEKAGRGIALTEAGRILTQHASKIIAQWHDASQELEALRTKVKQTLRIGAIQTVEYLLPPLLIAFSEQDPNAKIDLRIGAKDELLKLLRERSVDMVILENDT